MRKKRLIFIALITSLTLVFTACGGVDTEVSDASGGSGAATAPAEKAAAPGSKLSEEPAEAGSEEKTADENESKPSSESSLPQFKVNSENYESKGEHFYGSFERVEITDNDHQVLKEAVKDYFDVTRADYDKLCADYEAEADKAAEEAEKSGEEDPYTPSYSHGIYSKVTRSDNQMFSVCVNVYSFTGGAHGNSFSYGVNFDTETGEVLSARHIGDVTASVKDYVLKTIDESGKEAEEGLFPEYRDTIDTMFSQNMDELAYWFDDARLIVAFQEYDIAPHAAGILEFGVPYHDLTGFNTKYIPKRDFCAVTLNNNGFVDFIDVDGDGTDEKILLENKETDDYYSTFILHKDEDEETLKFEYYYSATPKFVHKGSDDYFFIEAMTDNDWTDTEMLDAKTLKLITEFEGSVRNIDEEKITIATRQNALGTWSGEKDYIYDNKGISTDQDHYRINNNAEGDDRASLTLKTDLKYHTAPGKADTETLKKGAKIYPTTLYKTEAGFETETGQEGFITYESDDENGGIRINGINENDIFDGIMYAG